MSIYIGYILSFAALRFNMSSLANEASLGSLQSCFLVKSYWDIIHIMSYNKLKDADGPDIQNKQSIE